MASDRLQNVDVRSGIIASSLMCMTSEGDLTIFVV
jgi:hypothetical protein